MLQKSALQSAPRWPGKASPCARLAPHNHLRATLRAGYADVDLKQALREGIIQGPRLLASTKAIDRHLRPQRLRPGMARSSRRRRGGWPRLA